MSKLSNILDGEGKGNFVKVNEGGYVLVQRSNLPPKDDRDIQIIYREFLTLNEDGSTISMLVNGSTTPQEFYISAKQDNDLYITSLSIIIQATGINLGTDFAGNLVGLTNGFRIYYEDKNGVKNIANNLTTNFDFIRLCQGNPPFGNNGNAFTIPNLSAKSGGKGGAPADGIIPVLDFPEVFGFNFGLRLQKGTNNRLVFEVNDNLTTGLGANAQMNVIAYGFERKPD